MLWVTAEVIPQLCELQPRGYCHSLGYSRGYTATLLVTAKATVCLSERGYCHSVGYTRGYKYCHSVAYSRGETAIVCLSERGYCHSLGSSRGDIATVCLSKNTHHVYIIYIRAAYWGVNLFKTQYWGWWPRVNIYIYVEFFAVLERLGSKSNILETRGPLNFLF